MKNQVDGEIGRSPSPQRTSPDGFVVVDKKAGWTSHDVVAKVRGILGTRKVGHSGTLDPDATGVLVLGVGRATRLLRYMQELPKTYLAEIVLGVETTTLDASGDVVATHDVTSIRPDQVTAAAARLTGDLMQVPPMVSAVKVGGRKLYELAREGVEIEREARPVRVDAFEVRPSESDSTVFEARVVCSSGTYVRVLAADLGRLLGAGAHLRQLRRTSVGGFGVDEAVGVDELSSADLITPADGLRFMSRLTVSEPLVGKVCSGSVFDHDTLQAVGDGPWAVCDDHGELLAVYEAAAGRIKPSVVLSSGQSPGQPSGESPGQSLGDRG